MQIEAKGWDPTPSDWATGFDIGVFDEPHRKLWNVHMSGLSVDRDYLFTDDDRRRMRLIRDEIINRINMNWFQLLVARLRNLVYNG